MLNNEITIVDNEQNIIKYLIKPGEFVKINIVYVNNTVQLVINGFSIIICEFILNKVGDEKNISYLVKEYSSYLLIDSSHYYIHIYNSMDKNIIEILNNDEDRNKDEEIYSEEFDITSNDITNILENTVNAIKNILVKNIIF